MPWRPALAKDDDRIVAMCLDLYAHDPPAGEVGELQIRDTLARFRAEPVRGRALVLQEGETLVGYVLLVSFWSNELAGEICTVDEVYVEPGQRGLGAGARLVEALRAGPPLWP